ncbi:MAG: TPMT family class I SAM-dependent methyltransferase [Verrucomicrobiae bacterium]|nr:TPMT family class I SAM-dependent methyltransferase [Verrucomicrobiae bacterium]
MSQNIWESRYQTSDRHWDKGAPSPGLVDFLAAHPNLPGHTVCVPGGGTGHDAGAWARAGFRVYGYDIAPTAIRLSRERAASQSWPAQFRELDFLRDEPPFQFDWLFEHTLFCAIEPEERDLYVRAVRRWVKPGGTYLAVNYLIPDTDGPPFGTTRKEIVERFSPHFRLREDWVPRSYPNRTGLERIFRWQANQSR